MKILHIVTYIDKNRSYGGPLTVALNLAEEQVLQGHEVTLLGLSDGTLPSNHMFEGEIKLILFNCKGPGKRRRFSNLWSLKGLVWLWNNASKFDVAHFHFSRDIWQSLACTVVLSRKAAILLQSHGMLTNLVARQKYYQNLYDLLFTKPIIRRADRVIALHFEEMSELKSRFGCTRLEIVANGVPFDAAWRPSPKRNLVAFISRLHPQKRPDIFLDAAIQVSDSLTNYEFVIAGPDGGLESLIVAKLSLLTHSRINYLGPLDKDGVVSVLKQAKLLVLPSLDDRFPMIALEALAQGTRVVLHKSSGIAKLIESEYLGSVCGSTVDDLTLVIKNALTYEVDPKTLRKTAEKIFDIRSVVEKLTAIYDDALANKASSQGLYR